MKASVSQNLKLQGFLSPALKQFQGILSLSINELEEAIDKELEQNPMIELARSPGSSKIGSPSDINALAEPPIKQPTNLEDHLLQQLHLAFDNRVSWKVGQMIIAHLNEDGFLTTPVQTLAKKLRVQVKRVERVLSGIQQFDPPGIAARDHRESLLIQINQANSPHKELAANIIADHYSLLIKNQFPKLSKRLKAPSTSLMPAIRFIQTLSPRPAHRFQDKDNNYHLKPDILIVESSTGQLEVVLNESELPELIISPTYRSLLRRRGVSPDEKEYIRNHIKKAHLFIDGIRRRQRTLQEISEYLLQKQKAFMEGDSTELQPLGLKDVSQSLAKDMATISRATKNKIIKTPIGMFPLKHFFSSSVKTSQGSDTSQQAVCERIRTMISKENKRRPHSDIEIQRELHQNGILVSRRTVTKYRNRMKILPSSMRKVF